MSNVNGVLILIVVEDGLVRINFIINICDKLEVLILIVVEDGLVLSCSVGPNSDDLES